MRQCNPDSITQQAPPCDLAEVSSGTAWTSPRPAHVIQLTDQRASTAVTLSPINSIFSGRAISLLPNAPAQVDPWAPGCSRFYKWINDLRAPLMAPSAPVEVRPK